jgi:hypothetical protein
MKPMIEVTQTYDLLPGIDQQAYGELAKKAVAAMLQAPGLVEFRANRNMLGSPQVRTTAVWQTLGDWAKARENPELQAFEPAFRAFITNVKVEIWGPSPILAEPVRPRE